VSPPLSVDHSTCQVLDGIDALLVCACVCSACNNYPDPADNALTWAAIRQASRSFLSLPGPVGFITAIDLGIGGAVHSPVKQPDGRRLALQILRKVYGRHDIVADGPTLDTPGPTVGSGSVTLPFRDAVSLHAAAVSKVRVPAACCRLRNSQRAWRNRERRRWLAARKARSSWVGRMATGLALPSL